MRKYLFASILCVFAINHLCGQITLDNASFEGEPQDATVPVNWFPCEKGTTPDILPGPWGVQTEASEGETYMGLITRKNGTWESVGQRLSEPLKKKTCYKFNLDLAHSKTYSGYNKSIKLKIWGGTRSCKKSQLLGETTFIDHAEWKNYQFQFVTKKKINYIIFEAYYMDGLFFHYNGNILIDNCSEFVECNRA